MSNTDSSFGVGIDFQHVLAAISKQIYETPLAFLRENVQNAVDAIRIQALRDNRHPSDEAYSVDIAIDGRDCTIRDNGIGMSKEDLRRFFWTIGASGKRSEEARKAGCVGMFGIGGFANFGVCDTLTVISQIEAEPRGTLTRLSEDAIRQAGSAIPQVASEPSDEAAPRGTLVVGHLREQPNVAELEGYIRDFVRFAGERITFNGRLITQSEMSSAEQMQNLVQLTKQPTIWRSGNLEIEGRLFHDQGHTLVTQLTNLSVDGRDYRFSGFLRCENGPIDVFKRGFKLCATKVQTQIGVSGRLDCDRLAPTAGRDSLNAESQALVGQIASCLEQVAVDAVLKSSDLIAQHTRVFPFILRQGWIDRLGNVEVSLADGSSRSLDAVRTCSHQGVGVFYGVHQKQALSQIMQARGNVVAMLPQDRHKQKAVQRYLDQHCSGQSFSGIVELQQVYDSLDRFEKAFLSELEMTIREAYDVKQVKLTPGDLTEDIPVFMSDEPAKSQMLEICVDVRHSEIVKLRKLGLTPLMYSMVAAFCREYLGPSLRKRSPKFFGSGAVNLDGLARRRSELWVIARDDIHSVSKKSQRQVVRRSDVHTVTAGGGDGGAAISDGDSGEPATKTPKLLHIQGDEEFADIIGYYIRPPEPATRAFGDVIKECDNRGVVWAGNKILFVASDGISSAFQFEIRLDHLIVTSRDDGEQSVEGAEELARPVQELSEGLYFPVPQVLEPNLVPQGDDEIRIEVTSGDWIDMKTSHAWQARASVEGV